jgi:hypothetical protein
LSTGEHDKVWLVGVRSVVRWGGIRSCLVRRVNRAARVVDSDVISRVLQRDSKHIQPLSMKMMCDGRLTKG